MRARVRDLKLLEVAFSIKLCGSTLCIQILTKIINFVIYCFYVRVSAKIINRNII